MRLKLPLLRARYIPPARAPILRYGVAVLSITLALIPALMLADRRRKPAGRVCRRHHGQRLVWRLEARPGRDFFCAHRQRLFFPPGGHSPAEYRKAIIHLTLFVFVALLICSFNAALRSAQEGLRRSEINFRSLVTNAPYGICRATRTEFCSARTRRW